MLYCVDNDYINIIIIKIKFINNNNTLLLLLPLPLLLLYQSIVSHENRPGAHKDGCLRSATPL